MTGAQLIEAGLLTLADEIQIIRDAEATRLRASAVRYALPTLPSPTQAAALLERFAQKLAGGSNGAELRAVAEGLGPRLDAELAECLGRAEGPRSVAPPPDVGLVDSPDWSSCKTVAEVRALLERATFNPGTSKDWATAVRVQKRAIAGGKSPLDLAGLEALAESKGRYGEAALEARVAELLAEARSLV